MKYQNNGEQRTSKNKLTKGAFGQQLIQQYETLKVIQKHKRTEENCNEHGVANINKFFITKEK